MSNDLEKQGDGGGETVQCPVCGVENLANAEVCIGCSFTFGEDSATSGNEQSQDIASEEANIMCDGCGAELPVDTTSCFICGEDVNALEEEISEDIGDSEPEAMVSDEPAKPDEDWDLGVIGGDGTVEDLDLDDELPPVEVEDESSPEDNELEMSDDASEPVDELPELDSNEFHCPSCSKPIPMGTSKCPNCWAEVPDMIRCPQCEITIPLESDACPECFVKLDKGVIVDETPVEAELAVAAFDTPEEDLMPQEDEFEEETEEFFEEVTEVYGVECPFCRAIANVSDDICPECGMPLIEEDEKPQKKESENLKYRQPERDWYRTIAFGLVLVLLVSAIIPFAVQLPHVDREQIRIDGNFGDWDPINTHNDSLDTSNPNVDIIDYKMISDVYNIYFYMQVAGTVFGDNQGDTSRIFIDADQNSTTGYSIMGIGADYQIRVFGHAGLVESSSCLIFDDSKAKNDFNGFESYCPSIPHTAETLEDNDKYEVRVALEDLGLEVAQPVTAVYYMADTSGNRDYTDTPITNVGSVLFVNQASLVGNSGLISGSSASVLSLEMTVIGNPVTIADVSIPDCSGSAPDTMEDGEVQFVNYTTSASSLSSGTFVHRSALPEHFDVPDTHIVITGQGAFAYANSAPATIEIDGAFADWAGKGLTIADPVEDQTLKNDVDVCDDTGLDILEQTTTLENNNLNILVDAEGDMFAGMWVPEMEEEYADTLPVDETRAQQPTNDDYTYTEPTVDRTRAPDLQRPTDKPEKTGEGAVKVFIDADNNPATGYSIGGIGADYLAEALGQDGQVTRTRFSSFTGTDQNVQEWTISSTYSPESATSGSNVEISIPLGAFGSDVNNNASAVIQLVDWNLNGDVSDISTWDIFETGTRRGTRVPGTPPNMVIGRLIDAPSHNAMGATMVAWDTNTQELATYVTSTDPAVTGSNYRVNFLGAGGTTIDLFGTNGTAYGTGTVVYPNSNIVREAATISMAGNSLLYANNFQVINLAPISTDAIQLSWDDSANPTSYRVYRTESTVCESGFDDYGRFYGSSPITGLLPGATNLFIDTAPVEDQMNWYLIQAISGSLYYSVELGVMADFTEPVIDDWYRSYWSASQVPMQLNITDAVGVESATLYYKKSTDVTYNSLSMDLSSGTPQDGEWFTWMPIDFTTAGDIDYDYYFSVSDGTFNELYGGPGAPITMTAAPTPDSPYPIYGYVWEYNYALGTWVTVAGADVFIEWENKTGEIINHPDVATYFPYLTNGAGQYTVDILDYNANSIVYANATEGGRWGYNQTQVVIMPVVELGGERVDIYLEAPALNITKTAQAIANPGETITYTVSVNNTGGTTAYNVNITETYPANVTFVTSSPDLPDIGDNVWLIGNLAPGEYYNLTIDVLINPAILPGTVMTNNVSASWANSTNITWGIVNAMANTTIGAANLNVTKWAPAFANTGEQITYWINYTNDGSEWASNIIITETYPANVSFVISIPAPDIGDNVWNIGILGPGDSNSIQITVQVSNNATGILNNTAFISGFDLAGILQLANATAWAETTIIDPLMTITKTGSATANTGEIITYTIDYQNTGTDWAYNVIITETYDPGVTFISSWPAPSAGDDTWNVGNLAPLASGTILVNVSIDALTGTINNTAILNYEDEQTEPQAPVQAWWDTIILNSDMLLNKTAPAIANTDEIITYTIDYFNIGSDTAMDVVITETYPIGVTYMGAIPAPDVPTNNVWTIGNVLPGTGGSIDITLLVNSNTSGIITNNVELIFNNSAGIPQIIVPATAATLIADPFMQINKDGPAAANSGQDITYWINYTNLGTGTAYNVVITETYPAGTTNFVGSIPAPDVPTDNVWTIGTIAPGASGSIQITVNIILGTSGVIMNEVMLEYEDNATASIGPIYGWLNTTVSDPLMDIIKIAPASASPGEIITYTIDYLNIGTDIAYNVVITEEYPAGVTFISAIPAPDVGNNVWNIGNVPIGGGGTITVTVQIDAMTTGTLDNYANLTYEDSFGQIMPEVPSFAQTIVTWPMMEVQKTGPATATDGETIEYIITYWNNGTDTAHNVTITETYPVNVTFEDANPMPDVPTDNVWTIGDVAAGASGIIFINVTIDANATGLLVNDITLDYETPGFIVQPPVLAQATTLLSGPYMIISKTTGQLIANTGELITYTITYDNIGTEDAENVIITETYPLGVTFISALPAPDIGNNIWVIPTVADGTGGVITITVQVDDWVPAGTVLNNIVEIDYNNTAGVPLPTESDDAQTTIVDPLMTITKTGPATANTGETITYTITYFNSGTEDAYNVWINETYDAGVSFVSAVPMPDVPDFAWDIGTVPMGTGGTILIDVTVDALVGTIWNYIDMNHTDDNDEYQMEIGDSCSTDIINPLIVLDKIAPANAAPGQTITYFINYFNLGNDWAFNINITETYPADVTFVSAVPVPTFGNDVWIIPALAPGANGVIAITVTVDSLAVGILENFVNATYEGTAGIQPVESQEWENTTVVNCLVDITKEAPATANTGEIITYWINYTNTGTDTAYNLWINETYPAGVTFSGSIPAPSAGNNVWFIPSLAPLASGSIQIFVLINAGTSGALVNTVDLEYSNIGEEQYTDTDPATTTVIDPVISIEKRGPSSGIAAPGEIIMYTIWVNNTGTDTAYNVVITETYPADVSFLNSSIPPDFGDNVWVAGDLPPGFSGVLFINVTVSPSASGVLVNSVLLESQNGAGISFDDIDTNVTTVLGPFIVIDKTAPATASDGETITYTITYQNTGPNTAYNVWINDTYPAEVSFVSAVPMPDVPNFAWNIGDLLPGASGVITIQVLITLPGAVTSAVLVNNATVQYSSINSGPNTLENWDNATTIVDGPLLEITKTAPATANTGEFITYVIQVTNVGAQPALNVIVTETYPANTTYIGGTPADIGDNVWLFPFILPGVTETISIILQVDDDASGVLMNEVSVDYQNAAVVDWPTNWAWANTTIIDPLLTISKTGPAIVNTGEVITYTITVTNIGTDIAYNVIVTDACPAEVIFVSSIPAPDDIMTNDTWTLGNLNPGETRVITISVLITETLSGPFDNVAYVDYENTVRPFPRLWANATTTIINPALTIDKVAPATANTGETITYTIWVNNTGDDWAYNIEVTEIYPAGATFVSSIPLPDIGNNIWNIAMIAPGGSISIVITMLVEDWASGWLDNNATMNHENNAGIVLPQLNGTASTLVVDPQMTITKSAPAFTTHDENLVYTIWYQNTGTDIAYNVVITEFYPADVTFFGAAPMPDIGNNVWLLGDIPPGAAIPITIMVTVDASASGFLVNDVELDYEDTNGQAQVTETDQAITQVIAPTLTIAKSAPMFVNTGETFTYTITVTNVGDDDADNVVVTEFYPVGVNFVSALPVPDIGNNIWNIGTMLSGEIVTIDVTVTVTALTGFLTNTVQADFDNWVGYAYPMVQTIAVTQVINPILTIEKAAPAFANTGEQITYTIWINNTGDDVAYNVVVTESYPADITFVSAIPVPDLGNNVWVLGSIAAGGSAAIVITVNVDLGLPLGTVLTNDVTADYDNAAGIVLPTESDTAITTIIDPVIVITKTGPAIAAPGEIIMYMITVVNTGTDIAYNVVITDTYPAGTTYINSTYPPDIGNNIWNAGNLLPGEGGVVFINVSVDAGTLGNITNLVEADYLNGVFIGMYTNASWTTLITGPFVSIQKTGPATATEGADITYTIVVNNTGDNDAYNVIVTETYPANVTFVSADLAPTSENDTWDLGTMAPGDVIWINITVNVDLGATILINNVVVNYSSDALGNVTTENPASLITIVNNPWVEITKTAPPFANWNETIMYTITYTNTGNANASNIWINETYSTDVTFVDASPAPDSGNGTWYIPLLAPGESGTIFINVTVNYSSPGIIYNYVELTFENPAALVMPTQMAWANTTIINPLINITKTGPAFVNPGETFTYFLNYENVGDDWAYDVVITEFYPAGINFVSSIPLAFSGNNVWVIPALAPGATGTIQITVTVTALSGTLFNGVEVNYNNSAGIPQYPVGASFETDIISPLMTVSKTAPDTAVPGEFITYTISYENTGDDWAYNVVITEQYPVGVTFVDAVPAPTIGDNVWQIVSIAPGGTGTITITVQVNNGTTGVLVNDVTLDYDNRIGTIMPQETATNSTTIVIPDLTVTKMAPATVNTGDTITYRIWVNTTGSSIATNIVVTETYPAGVTYLSAAPLPDAGNNVWFIPFLFANWFVDITVRVNDTAFGNLVNTVDVDYDDIIGQAYPIESDTNTTLVIDPLMDITKEGPAFANSGEIITYWVNYTNMGDDTAYNVVIIETYPGDVTFIGANPAPTFSDFRWDIGTVASGASVSIEITVMINNDASGFINNTVTLDYENSVRPMPQESAYLETEIIDPYVTINKVAPAFANPGEIIIYTITVQNTGDDWAYNIVVTETYPADVTFVSSLPVPDIGNNVWNIGLLAPGASTSIQIFVMVNLNASGIQENLVTVDYENSARPMPSDSDTAFTEIIYPTLTITKTAPATANPGETFTYTLTIENVGTDAAYNVVVTEYYPAGILYSTANPLPDIGQSIWLIGLIPAGSSVVIDITVTVDPGALGVVMNHGVANYTSSIGIYQPEVHDFVNTTILGPIMEITKAASPYANVGEQAIYWINYTNTGTDIAYNVTITETYPSGMTFDSAIPAPDIGDNVWLVGTVAPGGSGTIQITVDVIGPLPGQYVNLAELDYENAIGLDYPTISDTAITAIGNMPYMTVSKIGQAQANAGEEVMFTITYTNVGNVTAYFVNITDTYPFGLEFNTSVPLPTTGDGFWEIGTVLPGASATIIVYMNVTGDVYGILSNVVNISYESLAGEFFEEFIIWDIEIVDAFIDIDKTAPVTAVDGSTVTYTITYQNTGTDTAYNFTIIEAYPPDSTFISAVPVPTTGTNIWELGDLAPGASGTILIDITLSAATTFIQTNYANASWNNTIDVMSWANATATTTIEDSPEAIMVVEKWANATVNPGGTITYIINYTNLGAGAAINFWLNETFDIGTAWDGSGVPPTVGNNWLIGGVPGNSNGTLFINVSVGIGVLPGTILTNTVNFEYNDQSVLQTGSASANTLVVNPDVTITKTGPAVIYSGQVISYTITYQNNGDDYAYDLNITDTFPADIAYTGSIPAPDFGAPGSPACTWLINSVPPGGIGTIIVNGLVNALAPVDTVLENYVWLNYTNAAGAGFSDQDMVTTVVVGDIVTLDKTGPLTADPGETIFYNISYNNEATSAGPVNIVITEFYDNVTFVGSVPVPSNPGAGDNIWIIPNVAPDSGGIITITVTVNNTAPDIITNQVMLSYITGTTDVFLNATATTVISGPLMEITKTGPDDAVPGNTIMYTITYTNVGAGFANNVTITEIYPSMTSFNFALPAPNPGTDNVWTLGAIAPGDSFTIRIWVDISASAFGTLTNWAELTYQNMSGGSLPSEWASAATVLTGPTLTLVKSGPDTINSGQQITYTLTYNNIGRADASDVILEDAYPAGLVYVSSSDGGINMGGYVVWYLPDVPVGTGGTVTVTFNVVGYAEFDTFMNSAYLNYSDQSGTNDYYSADFYNTTVLDPHMTVSKWATPVANSGQLITYWINYSNPAGIFAQPAYNVVITETYDLANVVFISSIPAPSIGDNIWNLGTQMPGNSSSIMITVMVLPGTANDTWITNIVEMTFENSAMAMPPVQDSAQTYILNPELSIVKFGPATANTGETITYTIWVNNTGGAMAQNVVITETYPGELTFLDAFPLPDIGDNVWLIGDMAAQTSVMITITLQVNDGTSGLTATNDVAVNYDNENGAALTVVTDTVLTDIIDPVLTVTKDVSTVLTNTGEIIMYTINVTNIGNDVAYNVNITDVYSSWASFFNATPGPTFGDDVWIIGSIPVGITETIFINVTVDSQSTITNWVYVDYEDAVGEAQQQESDSATTLVRDPSMVITKIANATTVVDGYILYTITYRNMGSGNATNVVITETYSPNVTFIGADISPDIGDDTWIIGLVPAGTMVTINILVQVGNDTQIGDIITNDVDLYYEDLSGNPFSDADGTTTTIIGPNMTLSKEAVANITYEDGITFDYYINYTNAGDWAYNVVIMDELPQGVVVTASSPQPSFINGTMHYWNFSSIGPGTSGSIRITVEVQSGAPLNITNNVTLSYTNLVGWASTDLFDQANTTITYLVFEDPAMEIIKTGTANAYAGQMLNYSLEYWNNGTGAAYNVIITETYPTGLIYWNSSVTPTSYNNVWNLGMIPSGGHGWINITMLINSTLEGTIINNVSLECENVLGEQMPIEYAEFSSLIELILETEAPPEIITTPPEFVFAGQNFTLYATANDLDTGVDTVILYYTDINGVNWDSIMIPLLIDGDGNGMYTLLIPAQTFKGIVSYFVWANDTDGNANRTGIYDVPVRLPPYYVWGNIDSSSGIAVSGAIVQITDLMTNETVMAVTDGTGYYEVDMATLYSGYLNGENLSVFATDGLYYGTNSSYIDLDFYEDTGLDYYDGTGMEWPNRQVDVVLSEIPEFTMLLTPIIGILLIVVLIRRSRRREENECEI